MVDFTDQLLASQHISVCLWSERRWSKPGRASDPNFCIWHWICEWIKPKRGLVLIMCTHCLICNFLVQIKKCHETFWWTSFSVFSLHSVSSQCQHPQNSISFSDSKHFCFGLQMTQVIVCSSHTLQFFSDHVFNATWILNSELSMIWRFIANQCDVCTTWQICLGAVSLVLLFARSNKKFSCFFGFWVLSSVTNTLGH